MGSTRSDDIRGRWGRLIDNIASFTSLDLSGQSSSILFTISGQALTTNISGLVSGFAIGPTTVVAGSATFSQVIVQSGITAQQISGSSLNLQSGLVAQQISGASLNVSGLIFGAGSGLTLSVSGITSSVISGSTLNLQSGAVAGSVTVSGTTLLQGITTIGAAASGIVFSGLQMLPTMALPSYIVWVSGTNTGFRCQNTATGIIERSGGSGMAADTIQYAINQIAPSLKGTVGIKRGLYPLLTSLDISGDGIVLAGEGKQATELRASGVFPALIVRHGSHNNTIRDLYFTHNNPGSVYSGTALLQIGDDGGNGVTSNITGLIVQACEFYDYEQYTGDAIALQNLSGTMYRNTFENIIVTDFENTIRAKNGGSGANVFLNDNMFIDIYGNRSRKFFVLNQPVAGAFDANKFILCRHQAASGSMHGFDYASENSGRALYSTHVGCIIWDLTSGWNYAMIGPGTQLDTFGCLPSYKISGANSNTVNNARKWDFYTHNQGTFLGSGNDSTTIYTIAHGVAVTPNVITLQPGSSQAATSGRIMIASGGVSNIDVTFTTAPTSGDVRIHWTARY
mgnify:CR=1 FL=1